MQNWQNSKETMAELKVSSCTLAHIRIEGKIKFTKKGNAFFYDVQDVQKIKKEIAKPNQYGSI